MSKNVIRTISFIAIILGFFMALLDSTIVNIALPEMTKHYNTSVQNISWVINGYNLAFAVFIITAARLADQFGRKRIFIAGVFLFTLSSFLCSVAPSVNVLIVFRVLQGLSGAIVVPVTIPLAFQLFPKEKHGLVIGIWGGVSGLAAASGPALGGLLTSNFNWQSIFYVNIPIGIITILLSSVLLKESYDPTSTKKIDFGGVITISIAMFSVTYALIKANDFGWSSYKTIGLFALSLVTFLLFFLIELKGKEPMLPLWILKIPVFDGAALTLFVIGAGLMNATFLMSFFLTGIMGKTVLQAGLLISTMPLVSIVFSTISGPLSNKFGSRWFAVSGMITLILSVYLFSSLGSDAKNSEIMLKLALSGMGLGLSMAPVISSAVRNVPDDKVGMSSGITNMMRALGMVLGVAVIVTVLNSHMTDEIKITKTAIISEINNNKLLAPELKDKMSEEIKAAEIKSDSKSLSAEQILQMIDLQEKETLSKLPEDSKAAAKSQFEAQKKAVSQLIPSITAQFKESATRAFSKTFKTSSAILLIGILFALFSDKKMVTVKA